MVLNRRRLLGTLLVALAVLAAVVLAEVLRTVVFAVTVAYVLYPVRQSLVERRSSRRIAAETPGVRRSDSRRWGRLSAGSTSTAFPRPPVCSAFDVLD